MLLVMEPDQVSVVPAQVIDLGSAEFVQQGEEVPHAFGTVRYSSPEMAARSAGPASDVWSAGIVLCQVLTGKVPFLKDTDMDTLNYIMKGPEVRGAGATAWGTAELPSTPALL
jgi:calcium-dependent protein kinase